ncbi:replication factor C subunit 1-like [Artemia franciscana]|uniref:replication factor C subunit 1-like n=1 Tax=Artemia franciscana TaxID=6661 RepID=UPI0032DA6A19
MDEVDGMAGNEDRGGIQELIQLIKSSRIPIICICNDRSHPKIRSLVGYCFDLRMPRPRIEQIRGLIMSICFKEGIKIKPEAIDDMIRGTDFDIRQIINNLSVVAAKEKNVSSEGAKKDASASKKDVRMGPWDVIHKVFSAEEHKKMSIHDKSNMFFQDYSLGPLFVQDAYLQVVPHAAKGDEKKTLELISKSSDSLCDGDLVDRIIRSTNAWSLLPVQAIYSSVIPGDLMEGHFVGQIGFPQWLGKNSTTNKNDRLLQHLQMHMRLRISGSKRAVNLDYIQYIRDAVTRPLIKEGTDGVEKSVEAMTSYDLIREDLGDILSLTTWPGRKDPMSQVEAKVKSAFTRTFNKEGHLTPYADMKMSKVRGGGGFATEGLDEEGMTAEEEEALLEEDEDEDDLKKDAMIKVKSKPRSKKTEGDSTSKGKGKVTQGGNKPARGRGRGK